MKLFAASFVGHARTGSEVSNNGSSDDGAQIEVDRLLKKISEMNELLEARESKVVELSRSNMEIQEKNMDLSRLAIEYFSRPFIATHDCCSQVKEAMKINAKLSETAASNEEFTSRLAEMEKKLQKAIAEKDQLYQENKVNN